MVLYKLNTEAKSLLVNMKVRHCMGVFEERLCLTVFTQMQNFATFGVLTI